jgi:RNA polymerase sigma factor (sigma-70 family)
MRSYYLNQDITKTPIPTAAEERQMFSEYRERRTAKRREKIVRSYLQFALLQARRDMGTRAAGTRSRPGMSEDDSISAANLGLMTALDRFDPTRGFRFTTYAGFWIYKYLLEARYSAHLIGISDSDKRMFSRLSAMRRRLGLTDEEITSQTGIEQPEIDRVMGIAAGRCESFRAPDVDRPCTLSAAKAAAGVELFVEGPEGQLERAERISTLRTAVGRLPEQHRKVIEARFFKGLRNEQVAKSVGVSIHTVERLLREAKEELKEHFKNE